MFETSLTSLKNALKNKKKETFLNIFGYFLTLTSSFAIAMICAYVLSHVLEIKSISTPERLSIYIVVCALIYVIGEYICRKNSLDKEIKAYLQLMSSALFLIGVVIYLCLNQTVIGLFVGVVFCGAFIAIPGIILIRMEPTLDEYQTSKSHLSQEEETIEAYLDDLYDVEWTIENALGLIEEFFYVGCLILSASCISLYWQGRIDFAHTFICLMGMIVAGMLIIKTFREVAECLKKVLL